MLINSDFSLRACVTPGDYHWVSSPQPGVERVMLDRLGGEKARATSIVRYAPGSHFPPHSHPGGEEILVLSGTFSEGDTDYPAGWYLRNPPGSSHQPSSEPGATLFVKLWQMPAGETRSVRIDTGARSAWQPLGERVVCPLFSDPAEQVCLQRLPAGTALFPEPVPGAELLVLDGTLLEGETRYQAGSWLRLPMGQYPDLIAGPQGATLYLKTGHLPATEKETR
jgi:anti-sigma factor ChrR (cupin superfamily)